MIIKCQCGSHPPAKSESLELATLESVLADCRARKASAKPGEPAPFIACLSERLTAPKASAAAAAVQARLNAGRAMLAAAEAKASAKKAAAALKPAAPAVQLPAAKMPPGLGATARREWSKAQAAMSPANARTFSDSYLQVAAIHRNSPPAEAAIARAELESRGFVFHPSGTVSKSAT